MKESISFQMQSIIDDDVDNDLASLAEYTKNAFK